METLVASGIGVLVGMIFLGLGIIIIELGNIRNQLKESNRLKRLELKSKGVQCD